MKGTLERTLSEENILVMFPSAKNYPLKENLSDPLNDLLNEYSHLKDDDIPDYLDDRFYSEEIEEEQYESLEAFMNRNKTKEHLSVDDQMVLAVNEKIEEINRLKSQIKFYLDEIEMFMPNKISKR